MPKIKIGNYTIHTKVQATQINVSVFKTGEDLPLFGTILYQNDKDTRKAEEWALLRISKHLNSEQETKFPNGFENWAETHHEIVAEITLRSEQDKRDISDPPENLVQETEDEQGRGGLYDLAKNLTDKFEKINKGREWDGEFFDEIEEFLSFELAKEL